MQLAETFGPPVLYHTARLGISEPFLEAYASISNRHDVYSNIDRKIRDYQTPSFEDADGVVLFPLMHSQSSGTNYLYCTLAHAFQTRNIRPILLVCKNDMPLCLRKDYRRDDIGTCELCHFDTTSLLDAFGFEPTHLTELDVEHNNYDVENTISDGFNYNSIDVLPFANATTRRFSRVYRINENNLEEIRCRFVKTAMMLVDVTNKLIDKYDMDGVIAHHPEYVYGGVPLSTAAEQGISSISFGDGYYRENTLIFGNQKNRSGLPQFSNQEDVRTYISSGISNQERELIDEAMHERKSRVSDQINTNKSWCNSNLNNSAQTIGLFGNLLWDASIAGSDFVFENPMSWILTTIEDIKNKEHIELVIKSHPAESNKDTNETLFDWLSENIEQIPHNVHLLESDTDINPYQLIQDIDIGIVYNSTIGLEMAYDGIPVIVVGDTHYKDLGFTFDPDSIEQYLDLLSDISELNMNDNMIQKAQAYTYFLFMERCIDVSFVDQQRYESFEVTHKEILNDDMIDKVIRSIMFDEKTIAPNVGFSE